MAANANLTAAGSSDETTSSDESIPSENALLNNKSVDERYTTKTLKQIEEFFEYTKQFDPGEMSNGYKSTVYTLSAYLETLLHTWRLDSVHKNKARTNLDPKMWGNETTMKYLYDGYIEITTSTRYLHCQICKIFFQNTSENLLAHVKETSHVESFEKQKIQEALELDTLWHDPLQKHKYSKFVDVNSRNDNLFCRICCVELRKDGADLKSHCDEMAHAEKFEAILDLCISDFQNKKVVTKSMKNKVIALASPVELTEPDDEVNSTEKAGLNNLSSLSFVESNENNASHLTNLELNFLEEDLETNAEFKDFLAAVMIEVVNERAIGRAATRYRHGGNEVAFCCCLCRYYTTDLRQWNCHVLGREHLLLEAQRRDYRFCRCTCDLAILCNKQIYSYHLSCPEHKQIIDRETDDVESVASGGEDPGCENLLGCNKVGKSFPKGRKGKKLDGSSKPHVDLNGAASRSQENARLPTKVHQREQDLSAARTPEEVEEMYGTCDRANSDVSILGLKGFPDGTTESDVMKSLRHFGDINDIQIRGNSANISIKLKDEFSCIMDLQLDVYINGVNVPIVEPVTDLAVPESVMKFSEVGLEGIVDLISHLTITSNSCDDFIGPSQPNGKFNKSLSAMIKKDVRSALYKVDHIVTVGSRALGLAQRNSTLDMYIKIDDNSYFALDNSKEHFVNIQVIDEVVHFKHKMTDIRCKIFRSNLVIEKTNLIKTYLECDKRVREVILVIKEWAKETGLCEVISQYAVTWLVLYSLMQGEDPLLEPVNVLRGKNKDRGPRYVAGWDCQFCKNASVLPKTHCEKTSAQLIRDFFEFYSVAFLDNVYTPLSGKYTSKVFFEVFKLSALYNRFVDPTASESDVKKFASTKGLCFQDPLELNQNLTEALQGSALDDFIFLCKKTAAL